ncbi:NADPH:adrenodoxin oxidoreductase, mitochondrial isoform X2 [Magnolia sinica]|uniref:NADPH:adrenodoxin oxidoreductase, mitochondrial isoform X2 n=1 Tax=Magnolia sinica TaxID=86752 RepID=UPI00265A0B4C|nr:NADPH:adrenodoxin oxidoreductase, mitochondrial isoform X2 [Magnolia sinica]
MAFFHARKYLLLSRSLSSSLYSSRWLHVCVVGSGPAGLYTAEKMLKAHKGAEIDIIDRLPTPFGLVRSGVAPDHPETKDLKGIYSAREFVWWYNGHPDYNNLTPDLNSTDTAVVLGQGNVALDVARILLRPTAELATTDIADHALVSLQESSIRRVYLVGRRGPVQAACTAKELREILGIKDLYVHIQEADLLKSSADEKEMKNSRIQRRVYELLSKAATSQHAHPISGQRELHFVFFRRPDRFLHSDTGVNVSGVHFEKTHLQGDSGKQFAVGTGEFEDLDCGLVLKSIGYKSVPVDGLPFNHRKGVVPNVQGRVLGDTSEHAIIEKGLYVVGWLKRGPTGIIGTNLFCAEETVASISEDLQQGVLTPSSEPLKPGRQGLLQVLDSKDVRYVPFRGWEKIDMKEKIDGSLRNKPREKITSWEELLHVADG